MIARMNMLWRRIKGIYVKLPVPLVVVSWFSLLIALALTVIYVNRNTPSLEEKCRMECEKVNRVGVMVYVFRPEVTAGMRSRGGRKCECR
jgi:hypothetical protein